MRRWVKQWDATRIEGHDALDALAADLAADVPTTQRHTVVHGDYRLDNTLLDPTTPGRIAAVLDWEMSTLGDPLADVGILLGYWSQADDEGARTAALVVPAATVLEGFPTRAEVAERYAARTGLDLAPLPWYAAFAAFKLAVVCAGIVARVRGGAMVGYRLRRHRAAHRPAGRDRPLDAGRPGGLRPPAAPPAQPAACSVAQGTACPHSAQRACVRRHPRATGRCADRTAHRRAARSEMRSSASSSAGSGAGVGTDVGVAKRRAGAAGLFDMGSSEGVPRDATDPRGPRRARL